MSTTLPPLSTSGLRPGQHFLGEDEELIEVQVGNAGAVIWRSDCARCVRDGNGYGPRHDAARSCVSGGDSHCACDRCD